MLISLAARKDRHLTERLLFSGFCCPTLATTHQHHRSQYADCVPELLAGQGTKVIFNLPMGSHLQYRGAVCAFYAV
jgi:hypothetical protein